MNPSDLHNLKELRSEAELEHHLKEGWVLVETRKDRRQISPGIFKLRMTYLVCLPLKLDGVGGEKAGPATDSGSDANGVGR